MAFLKIKGNILFLKLALIFKKTFLSTIAKSSLQGVTC